MLPEYKDWLKYTLRLGTECSTYPTMLKMISQLSHTTGQLGKFAAEARSILATNFLPFPTALIAPKPENQTIFRWLHCEGCLTATKGTWMFSIASPLVHLLLLQKVIPID